ncbi:MAG: hypothetical protein QXI85_08165 [Desulfurococcaceae archaeon]
MHSFPFLDWLVILIALATTIAWLGAVYYAAHVASKKAETESKAYK